MDVKNNKIYLEVVRDLINASKPKTILDVPSGNGRIKTLLNFSHHIDGIDLFETKPDGYRAFFKFDLDRGIPDYLGKYDAIISCEGLEHLGNPLLFLSSIYNHLIDGGILILTTPNIWYPESKIKYLLRGFFPGFPSLIGKIDRGTHMHITPWSYPQVYTYLTLAGLSNIFLHEDEEKKPKHIIERVIGFPQKLYLKKKVDSSKTDEEIGHWLTSASDQSIYGRRLIISARK
tara:strand:+ start:1748 stop:2443 length:696 start_codon:yes stop_codon:yes gene_type:complete